MIEAKELLFKIVDRFGAALLIAVCTYGANQVKALYESVNKLSENVAVIAVVINKQGDQLKELTERVSYLERRK